jgi:diguanylate cyclase (GGDEF)-like protein
MKVSSARTEAFAAIRRRGLAEAGARAVAAAPGADKAEFLGLTEAELTPAVKAALATLAIEIDDLRAEVRRLKARLAEAETEADTDPLTGVNNRRAFIRELKRIAAFAQRNGAPVSLLYVDIDDLRAVNERFGHAVGDAALHQVAARIQSQLRETDIVGRMGGDEFAILLAPADAGVATARAEALARAITAEPIQAGAWLAPVRVSWGVRQLDPALDAESQIADADAAMMAMHRNRVA